MTIAMNARGQRTEDGGQGTRIEFCPGLLRRLPSALRRPSVAVGLLSSVLCLLSSGCSLPEAQADPTRFYVLSTPTTTHSAAAANAPSVRVRPVELASYMRARPLIVRRSENEVEFREFARWGEPLDQGVARVLREELLGRGSVSAVAVSGVRAASRPYDFELAVRVLSAEGEANGGVNFRAIWELWAAGEKNRPAARGDYRAEGLRWDGKAEATLAAELSKAVAGLAGDVGAGLKR
jgi:uncharacterized lipoprotein YmbA